jgi:uncharacterized protein with FMN-binding domain
MSEHDDWLQSLERAIEVTEGQLVLARLLKVDIITVQTDRARVLIEAIRRWQRKVRELESERR